MTSPPNRFLLAISRHPAVFISVMVLLLGMGVGAAYLQGERVALERVEGVIDGRVNAHKRYLLESLGKFSLVPEIVATSPYVREMLKNPIPQHIAATSNYLDEVSSKIRVDRIYVMDVNGTTIAANQGHMQGSIIGNNYKFRPYFQQALAGKTGHYVALGISSPVIGYFISRPVLADNKVIGVSAIRVSLPIEAFRSVVKQYWEGDAEVSLIADPQGVIFMSPIDKWLFRTIAPLPEETRKSIKDSRQFGDHPFLPISIKIGEQLTSQVRFVQFADIPGRSYLQKSFEADEIGGRIYIHVSAVRYWELVATYTVVAALIALAILLLAIAVVQRWSFQAKLIEAAIRDPLTGMHTRLYMNDWIQTAMRAHARDPKAGFALVLFDVDHFKLVNDNYGHLIGDAVLKGIARMILQSIRAEDLAVRFGGEEFAVFVRFADKPGAVVFSERLRKKIEASGVQTDAGHIPVSVSGGIEYHAVGQTPTALFANADKKLYEAKQRGRNQICA